MQLRISFSICYLEKHDFYQQERLELIDNCTWRNAPSRCLEISLASYLNPGASRDLNSNFKLVCQCWGSPTPKLCYLWEGIKGLLLRHCGKLKSTHPSKLWVAAIHHQIMDCSSYKFEGSCRNPPAAIHEVECVLWPQCTSRNPWGELHPPRGLRQRRNISPCIQSPIS